MKLKEITLLSKEEYEKYKILFPPLSWFWWLRDAVSVYEKYVAVANSVIGGHGLDTVNCSNNRGGVRPACVFEFGLDDPLFWHKTETNIGSKIKFGKRQWTVLHVQDDMVYALCDDIIAMRRLDSETGIWESSELKKWLETEGLRLITA